MREYRHPEIEPLEFYDDAGTLINYGERWQDLDGPPEDSYSVLEHPERFAPLHTVATAIVEHLVDLYAPRIEEGTHLLENFPHVPSAESVLRVVRLTSQTPNSAPITLVWADPPAIRIYAGALFSSAYPSCSCNACDERWNECADALELDIFSIIAGGLTEHVSAPKRPTLSFDRRGGFSLGIGQSVSYSLRTLDGSSEASSESSAKDVPPSILDVAQATLKDVHASSPAGNWLPWLALPS